MSISTWKRVEPSGQPSSHRHLLFSLQSRLPQHSMEAQTQVMFQIGKPVGTQGYSRYQTTACPSPSLPRFSKHSVGFPVLSRCFAHIDKTRAALYCWKAFIHMLISLLYPFLLGTQWSQMQKPKAFSWSPSISPRP